MANKLYTTYTSKLKTIDFSNLNTSVAIIMLFPPFIPKDKGFIHVPELAPHKEIFSKYKKDGDWDSFKESYNQQLYEDPITKEFITFLIEALEQNSVTLVCCEKDNTHCHRRLIAEYITELGFEWEEI